MGTKTQEALNKLHEALAFQLSVVQSIADGLAQETQEGESTIRLEGRELWTDNAGWLDTADIVRESQSLQAALLEEHRWEP